MKPVTDPNILALLNSDKSKPVTDPDLLAQLNQEPSIGQQIVERFKAGKDLPMLGSLAGGVGGTVLGGGAASVPFGVTGAALGGATGEAGRQLLQRFRGQSSPETSMEAAKEIGTQGVLG